MRSLSRRLRFLAGFLAGLGMVALRSTGRADAPAGRYTVTFDVVFDQRTGLYWERAISPEATDYLGAASYCSTVSAGGTLDWRVPSIKELQTIVDEARTNGEGAPDYPLVDQSVFGNSGLFSFWSSSESATDSTLAWSLDLSNDAGANLGSKSAAMYVRCVRP